MADHFKRLGKASPGAATVAIYTVGGSKEAIVRYIRCVNIDTQARPITLYESGIDPDDIWQPQTTLQPGEAIEFPCFVTMEAGSYIAGKSDATGAVNVFVYGMETDV